MFPDSLTLEVVTPERRVLSETVDEVVLPGSEGSLGVRPGHTPLLTSLGAGELSYTRGGVTRRLAASGGYAEILPDRVIVLAEASERAEEIDVERARDRAETYRKILRDPEPEVDLLMIQAKLQKHLARVSVAGRR